VHCILQENVFNLKGSELRSRELDYIDIVNDPLPSGEYKEDEDPVIFKSQKTNRGPLSADWRRSPPNGIIMCSYKLCKVEFRYWGMQSRVERLIHDYGLRRVMLRAHRQAWVWQDEWVGLTMADIRQLEREAQIELRRKLGRPIHSDSEVETASKGSDDDQSMVSPGENTMPVSSAHSSGNEDLILNPARMDPLTQQRMTRRSSARERQESDFHIESRIQCNLDVLEQCDSDDEYHDATDGKDYFSVHEGNGEDDFYSFTSEEHFAQQEHGAHDHDDENHDGHLFIVVHGGSTCMNTKEAFPIECSFDIIQKTLLSVIKAQFLSAVDSVAVYPVYCPPIKDAAISTVVSLQPSSTACMSSHDVQTPALWIPGIATALMMTNFPEYEEHLNDTVKLLNEVYTTFLKSDKGQKFRGQVTLHVL
jgi:hypothetical protein